MQLPAKEGRRFCWSRHRQHGRYRDKRKVLSLVQGSIQKVKLDCAVIISKPSRSKADEPAACLGLWRMDKIDMSSSSILPRKDEKLLLKEASAKLLHVNASGL
jgi:hypothetical protein